MAINERLHYFRELHGITLKELGEALDFSEETAANRIAQYESGQRIPKDDMLERFAEAFEVSPMAIAVPNTNTELQLIHTLFALEDLYGLTPEMVNGEVILKFVPSCYTRPMNPEILKAWAFEYKKLKCSQRTADAYNNWRYNYPWVYDENNPYHIADEAYKDFSYDARTESKVKTNKG